MRTPFVVLGIVAGILSIPLSLPLFDKMLARYETSVQINKNVKELTLPAAEEALELNLEEPKVFDIKKTITLESKNSVVLRGPVTGSSVGKIMKQLNEISRSVSKDTPIFLVLDTPGGSIDAGNDLIDLAKALPQKVHTVTLFAASMGFQIAQNLDKRYIIRNGTLMSHRANVRGLAGQVKGELESRYKMIRRQVDYLDFIAAKRLGLDVKTYDALILNEYWVHGFDAVEKKIADEQVMVRCGDSMIGSEVVKYDTIFGAVYVTFSKCPLIKEPEAINFGGMSLENKRVVSKSLKLAIENKPKFVREYITTPRFDEVFR